MALHQTLRKSYTKDTPESSIIFFVSQLTYMHKTSSNNGPEMCRHVLVLCQALQVSRSSDSAAGHRVPSHKWGHSIKIGKALILSIIEWFCILQDADSYYYGNAYNLYEDNSVWIICACSFRVKCDHMWVFITFQRCIGCPCRCQTK